VKKIKVFCLALAVSFMMGTVLTGCGDKAATTGNSADTSKTEVAAETKADASKTEEAKKPEKVTFVTQANDQMTETEKQFRAAYDAEFEIVALPASELLPKIQLDAMSGTNAYDIYSTGQGAVQFGLSGIADELPKLDDWDDIFPGLRANYQFGDKIYGWPVQADTCLLFYRTDLLEKAGFKEPPKTYDEYREMAIKMTTDVNGKHPGDKGFNADKIEIYGSNYKGGNFDSNTWEFYNYMLANGGKTHEIDFTNNTYKVTINEKPAVDTLTYIVDNYRKYNIYPKGAINSDWAEFHTLFVEGKVALSVNYGYMFDMANADNSKVKDKFSVGLLPKGTVKNGAEMGGWVISLAKGSKHKEDALRFMKFVASSKGSTIYADTQGAMVPRQSDFQKKIDAAEGPMKVKLQQLLLNLNNAESVDLTKLGASYDASVKIMNATVNMALTGKVTPQEAMDSAKKQLEDLLTKDKFLK